MMKVFILDDDVILGKTLVRAAKIAGYDADAMTSPSDLFARAARCAEGAILFLDLDLDQTDAAKVMSDLAREHFRHPIVLMSGVGERVLEAMARIGNGHRLKVAGRLRKPFGIGEFQERLVELTDPSAQVPGPRLPSAVPVSPDIDVPAIVERGTWELHYQPLILAATGRVKGFEALSRIRDENGEHVPTEAFFQALDESEYLFLRTEQILARAMQWLAQEFPDHPYGVSINISPKFCSRDNCVETIRSICADAGLTPQRVTLEISEGARIVGNASSLEHMTRLRIVGFRLSMDDYGAGYSGLKNLSDFPFSELKVDRQFALTMTERPAAREIVKTAIGFAKKLEMDVCAEGVETADLAEQLTSLGATTLQGYYFARPMTGPDVLAWLETTSGTSTSEAEKQIALDRIGSAIRPGRSIAIVDDDMGVRRTLVKGLSDLGFVCHPFASGKDFLASLSAEIPDCVLLDLRMPGENGLETFRLMQKQARHVPVLVLTSHGETRTAVDFLHDGGFDFLEKPLPISELAERISMALERAREIRRAVDAEKENSAMFARLTEREKTVAVRVFHGDRTKEIAIKLGLSPRTVEVHRSHVMRKLECRSLSELVKMLGTIPAAASHNSP